MESQEDLEMWTFIPRPQFDEGIFQALYCGARILISHKEDKLGPLTML